MKELWSPGAGVVKRLPPLHHESARLSVSRPESGCPRDRNAGLRRLRNPASEIGGAEGSRTPDPKTASLVLSQLSYSPTRETTLQACAECCQGMVPEAGFEPARPCGHWILSPAWLPLHHSGPDPRRCLRVPQCTATRLGVARLNAPRHSQGEKGIFRLCPACGRGREHPVRNTSNRAAV